MPPDQNQEVVEAKIREAQRKYRIAQSEHIDAWFARIVYSIGSLVMWCCAIGNLFAAYDKHKELLGIIHIGTAIIFVQIAVSVGPLRRQASDKTFMLKQKLIAWEKTAKSKGIDPNGPSL